MLCKHYIRRPRSLQPASYTPTQIAALYTFPTKLKVVKPTTIGIVELGGGHSAADLTAYFQALGQPAPVVTTLSIQGAKSSPGTDADGEVMLDIEVAAAVYSYCTGLPANVLVAYAPNTTAGFVAAINALVAAGVAVISISWGGSESQWTQADAAAMNAAIQDAVAAGITVLVASGDNGASDGLAGLNVDFPASCPFALACGGTSLRSANGVITSETTWNNGGNGGATGGGISSLFAPPSYQTGFLPAGTTGRGSPDVAGNADPETGYVVRVQGQNTVIGGTSAVAPLYAGLIAAIVAATGKPLGLLQSLLYPNEATVCRDVVSGNNAGYTAGPGYDFDTGLGVINGTQLLALAQGTAPTPPPVQPPVNPPPVVPPVPVAPTPLFSLTFPAAQRAGTVERIRLPVAVPAGTYNVVPATAPAIVTHAE